ncbi:MAG: hypothetical protein AB4352_17260 [Hormoscilla sp.]
MTTPHAIASSAHEFSVTQQIATVAPGHGNRYLTVTSADLWMPCPYHVRNHIRSQILFVRRTHAIASEVCMSIIISV